MPDDDFKDKLMGIVDGDYGEVEVNMDVVRSLVGSGLANPSTLATHQILDEGYRDVYVYGRSDSVEIVRAASYSLDLPEGEGMTYESRDRIGLYAGYHEDGRFDFNSWKLSRGKM